jgi:predicted ATPase
MHIREISIQREKFPTEAHYPFSLPVIQETVSVPLRTPVTFFVGENGTGKSTLLRAAAEQSGILIWENTGALRYDRNPYRNRLRECVTVEWVAERVPGSFFGADIFEYFTEVLDEWAESDPGQLKYFGGQSLRSMSHGQSLLAFFRSRYRIPGVFFLDEPETALSPRSQLELLEMLGMLTADGHAQFIIASHSPILLAHPGADIYSFDSVPIAPIAYRDTAHYKIYAEFLARQSQTQSPAKAKQP